MADGENIEALFKELAEKLDGHSPEARKDLIEKYLPTLLGEAPEWAQVQTSHGGGWTIGLGKTFNMGGFCTFYSFDEETQQPVLLIQERKEKGPNGEKRYGSIGGYVTSPEQDFEGLGREICEEVCDDKGTPIFIPELMRMQPILNGVNNLVEPNISYTGFAYRLNQSEINTLKAHIKKLDHDDNYRAKVTQATKDEVFGLKLMGFDDFEQNMPLSAFTYHRQHDLTRFVIDSLKERQKTTGKPMQSIVNEYKIFGELNERGPLFISHLADEDGNRRIGWKNLVTNPVLPENGKTQNSR